MTGGVWLTTLLLTVFAYLTVAVEAGMILAALLFISRTSARFLRRAGFAHHIGPRNVCESVDDALARAREIQRTHEWW